MPARSPALIAASILAFTNADAQQVIPLWEVGAPGFGPQRLAEWLQDRGYLRGAP